MENSARLQLLTPPVAPGGADAAQEYTTNYYLTVEEAAKRLRVSKTIIYEALKKKQLPFAV